MDHRRTGPLHGHDHDLVRTALRDTLVKSNALVKRLKAHRRTSHTLETTLAILRQLKGLSI